ncbi:MAG: hypothetical protein KKC46_20605 [Proteobacteria bacterium]|nr:hypothetical protein [Pseudomonadota bacterium]
MAEEINTCSDDIKDRRQLKGTWLWFVLNVILFPAPAHFTLLRIKDFRFAKSLKHLGGTLFLIFILLISALFQLIFPYFGSLWMLIPALSGFIVICAKYSLKDNFTPFDISPVTKTHLHLFLFLVLLFTVLSIIPDLDLIELNQESVKGYKIWIEELPFWQDLLILVSGIFVLLAGYMTNANKTFSINRTFILYACFIVFVFLLSVTLIFLFAWLKIRGGFWTQLVLVLLCAILALDYWDAKSFGQYTRRFFFLTCTKGFCFIFLWLCFLGLPQKVASTFSLYNFNKSKPVVSQRIYEHLIFTDRDRFNSAHNAARRMRYLYTRAFNSNPEELSLVCELLNGKKDIIIPADADICRLADLIDKRKVQSSSMSFDKVPIFRPIHPDWDVMLTALLMQGTISKENLNKFIADFKTMLPKSSHGRLPYIDMPYKASYLSLATKTKVDFIPPRLELLEKLLERKLCPVLCLKLSGKEYWAALLHIDPQSGLAWFRIQTPSDMNKSIKTLFDSDESKVLKDEILSRTMVPISLDYLKDVLPHYSGAVIVFTKKGLDKAMPDLFAEKDLAELKRAIKFAVNPEFSSTPVINAKQNGLFPKYANYTRAVALIKAMLEPTPYEQDLFFRPKISSFNKKGFGRIKEIEALLQRIGTLRDSDRIDIASLLVENNHVNGAPDLFLRLVTGNIISSDLVDCHDAFIIGRELFLLGYHEKAYNYLKLTFLRHPFSCEYEMWYHIAGVKLKKPPSPFYSPPDHEPHLYLYYQTIADIRDGQSKTALKRLEKTLKKDSHNSLAAHLLSKYFNKPLDERYFLPAQEGL